MTLLIRLFLLLITIAAIVFAVSNRDLVTVSLWPLAYEARLPLFAALFGGVVVGFLYGSLAVWYGGRHQRRRAREDRRRSKALARQLEEIETRAPRLKGPISEYPREKAPEAHQGREDALLPPGAESRP